MLFYIIINTFLLIQYSCICSQIFQTLITLLYRPYVGYKTNTSNAKCVANSHFEWKVDCTP